MLRTSRGITRLLSSLVILAALGFGVRSAVAAPVASSCPLISEGMHNLTCSVGAAGNAYCDRECKRIHGDESIGECFVENCCLCTI